MCNLARKRACAAQDEEERRKIICDEIDFRPGESVKGVIIPAGAQPPAIDAFVDFVTFLPYITINYGASASITNLLRNNFEGFGRFRQISRLNVITEFYDDNIKAPNYVLNICSWTHLHECKILSNCLGMASKIPHFFLLCHLLRQINKAIFCKDPAEGVSSNDWNTLCTIGLHFERNTETYEDWVCLDNLLQKIAHTIRFR
jgi:hypothetical protein